MPGPTKVALSEKEIADLYNVLSSIDPNLLNSLPGFISKIQDTPNVPAINPTEAINRFTDEELAILFIYLMNRIVKLPGGSSSRINPNLMDPILEFIRNIQDKAINKIAKEKLYTDFIDLIKSIEKLPGDPSTPPKFPWEKRK